MTEKQETLNDNAKVALQKVKVVNFNEVEERIITLRGENVLLDSDVAYLYGVQTKEVNQAVKNNHGRFPDGYIFELQNTEKQQLVKNFDRFD